MKFFCFEYKLPLIKNVFKCIFIIKFLILINILAGVNLSALGFGYDMQQLKITGTVTTTLQLINCQDRKAVKRMYWIAIATDELKKAPQLVQNPGY